MSDLQTNYAKKVSQLDVTNLQLIRSNVSKFVREFGSSWGEKPGRLLDIAPHDHEGARPYFSPAVQVETLDINPQAGTTYCADICQTNATIPGGIFDIIVCTEVLEHVTNPFSAVAELRRLLKPRGILLASSPFNFRIHGPHPDCWRFTEHGWRALLRDFENIMISALEDEERLFMPVHYTVSAQKAL